MQTPVWLKPGIYGAIGGAAAAMILGFSWGGWVTGGTVRQLVSDGSDAALVNALIPVCVDISRRDPQGAERLAQLKGSSSYGRGDLVIKNGWATVPGTSDPNRRVANACADRLASG
ncbi:MAG: hypothetical protein IT561_04765 [Alphaproteobacteria bacterium]|nr:hypothetical protein [Alphaproteobacteria bacterium]